MRHRDDFSAIERLRGVRRDAKRLILRMLNQMLRQVRCGRWSRPFQSSYGVCHPRFFGLKHRRLMLPPRASSNHLFLQRMPDGQC